MDESLASTLTNWNWKIFLTFHIFYIKAKMTVIIYQKLEAYVRLQSPKRLIFNKKRNWIHLRLDGKFCLSCHSSLFWQVMIRKWLFHPYSLAAYLKQCGQISKNCCCCPWWVLTHLLCTQGCFASGYLCCSIHNICKLGRKERLKIPWPPAFDGSILLAISVCVG